jgi:hypothetical protein
MDYLNEYQREKARYINDYEYRISKFPSYREWRMIHIQTNILGGEFSKQSVADTVRVGNGVGSTWLNEKNQEDTKLSIKKRLRKKLEEKRLKN